MNKEKDFYIGKIIENVPSKKALLLADALLFSVYGWDTEKTKNMKLSSLERWIGYAKKRMTWGDAMKLRAIVEPQKKSFIKKLVKRIKR